MLWEKNGILLNDKLMVLMTSSNRGINTVPKKKSSGLCFHYHCMTQMNLLFVHLKNVLLSFVLISQGCHTKYYKLGSLKSQECFLSPCQQILGEIPCLFQPPLAPGFPFLWQHSSSLCPVFTWSSSLCLSMSKVSISFSL